MDSGFASTMKQAIETLTSSFSSFTGGTITGGVWEGDAADNAKNQVTEKIDPKAEAAQKKLDNLIEAIQQAANAEAAKENIAKADEAIDNVKKSDAPQGEKNAEIKTLEADKAKFQKEYDDAVAQVKSLCGS